MKNKNLNKENIKFVSAVIKKVNRNEDVNEEEVRRAVEVVLKENIPCRDIFLGSLFSSLMHIKKIGIVKAAIQGALDLDGILSKKVDLGRAVYSIGGSGKDDIKTFNISSITALVASAMGITIFKVGAPGTSNKLGSRDLLDFMKIPKIKKLKEIKQCRNENFIYMSVDDIVPNLFSFYDGLFFYPNILSYGLLPLVTPINLSGMIYGVSMPCTEISANLLKEFGMRNVLIVAGMDNSGKNFFDEISIIGKTKITHIDHSGCAKNSVFDPADLGLKYKDIDKIYEARNRMEAKQKAINILRGKASRIEMDVIAVNVGGLLFLSGKASSIENGYFIAIEFLRRGKAFDHFKSLSSI